MHIAIIGLVGSLFAGMLLFAIGEIANLEWLAKLGAWLTLPMTAVYAIGFALMVPAAAVSAISWAWQAGLRAWRRYTQH